MKSGGNMKKMLKDHLVDSMASVRSCYDCARGQFWESWDSECSNVLKCAKHMPISQRDRAYKHGRCPLFIGGTATCMNPAKAADWLGAAFIWAFAIGVIIVLACVYG